MGSDYGAWKLLIYPLAIILILGFVIGFVIEPFASSQSVPPVASPLLDYYIELLSTGSVFNGWSFTVFGITFAIDAPIQFVYTILMPDIIKDFLVTQVSMLGYIPLIISTPILILLSVSMVYLIYTLIAMLIP